MATASIVEQRVAATASTPEQSQATRDRLEDALTRATSRAIKRYLRTVLREVTAKIDAASSLDAITAAGAQDPLDPLALGDLYGWWGEAAEKEIVAEVRAAWQEVYREVAPGATVTATSLDGLDDYMIRVNDRLVRGEGVTPAITEYSFEEVRISVTQAAAEGWSRKELAQDLAARLSWETDGPYWRSRKDAIDYQINLALDLWGPQGSPEREHARLHDPYIQGLRDERNTAIAHLNAEKSTWETRATMIARTEATGAYGYAANRALIDEGWVAKRWLSVSDHRTRPDHAAASGQIVAVTDAFQVGGYPMQFPGDPAAPASEVINCRCTVVGEDKIGEDSVGIAPPSAPPSAPVSSTGPSAPPPLSAAVQQAQDPREAIDDPGTWDTAELLERADRIRNDLVQVYADGQRGLYQGGETWRAWENYTGAGYAPINTSLRRGGQIDPLVAQRIKALDQFFDDWGTSEVDDMMVMRAIKPSQLQGFDPAQFYREGDLVHHPGYLSTTTNAEVAEGYLDLDSNPWILSIRVPGGQRFIGGYEEEAELIFPRGTNLRVLKVDPVSRKVWAVIE